MKHPLVAALVVALSFGIGFAIASTDAVAQGAPPDAVCTTVLQDVAGTNADAVARWMNEQIAAGRRNFEGVPGVVTLMCAW